ncbi:site-specific integrase [Actinomadura madurae]|uniref:site-specific integrase n=1 Tax=Actinomadura madurae TaxID=1993 RepID=UPI00399A73BD
MKGSVYKRCKCRGAGGKELASRCPQLRHEDGTWNPRHGTWYFYLELDAGPGGKRRRLRRGGFTTQEDAEKALEDARCRALRGLDPGARYTVGQYLDEWLAGHSGLRRSTSKSYGEHIQHYLKPHLGHIELDQLCVVHVNEMFAAIDADNERILWAVGERRRLLAGARQAWRSGDKIAHRAARAELAGIPPHRRTVGAATMQRIRATLRSALADAVRQGLTAVNVAKLTKLQTGKRPKALVWTSERVTAWQTAYERELAAERASGRTVNAFKVWMSLPRPSRVMVWTPEQTGTFLDHAADHSLYPLLHLMAFRGLRRGEACGLAWPDLDLAGASLAVRENRVKITYREIEDGYPKSDAGEDTIPLDSGTVTVLEAHHRRQDEARAEWGQAWQESGKVFTREDGSALHPDHVTDTFARLAYGAGLPPIRLHDLRHGAATLMLAGGADMKLVQALLRHSSLAITADTYTSVLPEVAREAAEAAAALVPRKIPTQEARPPVLPASSQDEEE